MLRNGEVTSEPAVLPERFELLTLKHAIPGDTFVVRSYFIHLDPNGLCWARRDADIDEDLPASQKAVRLIKLEEGLILDMFSKEGFSRPKGFEKRAAEPDPESYFPIVGYITNQAEFEAVTRIYKKQFGREFETKPRRVTATPTLTELLDIQGMKKGIMWARQKLAK